MRTGLFNDQYSPLSLYSQVKIKMPYECNRTLATLHSTFFSLYCFQMSMNVSEVTLAATTTRVSTPMVDTPVSALQELQVV